MPKEAFDVVARDARELATLFSACHPLAESFHAFAGEVKRLFPDAHLRAYVERDRARPSRRWPVLVVLVCEDAHDVRTIEAAVYTAWRDRVTCAPGLWMCYRVERIPAAPMS